MKDKNMYVHEAAEKNENKKKKPILIIILVVIILALIGALAFFILNDNDKTAIIVETDMELQDVENDGMIRIKMNPYINVQKDTMQNLEFYNLNEGRLLQLKIKAKDKYVYESELIEEGKIVKADVIDTKDLPSGETEALAEVYSYTPDGELVAQTNVEIVLNCK